MSFYMDIAEPARDRATKNLRALTEAEADEFGTTLPRQLTAAEADPFGTTAQLPLAPSPDLSTMAGRIEAASLQDYPEQPESGSIAAGLGLERRDALPLPTGQDIFSQAGRGAVKYGVEPSLAFAEAVAQGVPYVKEFLAGDLGDLYTAPGGPTGAYPEPKADVLGLFRGQGVKEVGQALLESYAEKPLYGQIITEVLFSPYNAIPIPIKGLPRAGYGKFNIPATRTVWQDAPAATRAAIKTQLNDQLGGRIAEQVRQAAPDLAPNRVNEIVDTLLDDFMKPGMKPEEFQKHADLVIDRVRGYDRPPTARPTVRPDAAPMPALEPALPVAAAAPEPVVVTPRAAAAVTPELPAEAQKIRIKVIEDQPRVKVIEKEPLSGPLPENGPPIAPDSGIHRVYHGTDKVFDAFDKGAQSSDALYGPGVYTTEDAAIASTYATGKGPKVKLLPDVGQPAAVPEPEKIGNVWSMDIRVDKFLDIDAVPDAELLDILRQEGHFTDEKVRAAFPALPDYRGGLPENWTNKELYRFLAEKEFGNKAAVNDWLIDHGYDAITHIGGRDIGTQDHRVWVSLDSETVSPAFGKDKPSAAAMIDAPEAAAPIVRADEKVIGRSVTENTEQFPEGLYSKTPSTTHSWRSMGEFEYNKMAQGENFGRQWQGFSFDTQGNRISGEIDENAIAYWADSPDGCSRSRRNTGHDVSSRSRYSSKDVAKRAASDYWRKGN